MSVRTRTNVVNRQDGAIDASLASSHGQHGQARLEQLYQIGNAQTKTQLLDSVVSDVSDDLVKSDIGALNETMKKAPLMSNEDIGAFDWSVDFSNFEFKTTLAGLEGVHFGTRRVLSNNYVEYTHAFPPFMVKVKGMDTSISEAKFITVHPLSVKVFNALTTTPSFMISDLETNSTPSELKGMIDGVCFEIADIDAHFTDVINNMNIAYSYYEKEEKAWKRKNMPGVHDATHRNNTMPSFMERPQGPPGSNEGSASMKTEGYSW